MTLPFPSGKLPCRSVPRAAMRRGLLLATCLVYWVWPAVTGWSQLTVVGRQELSGSLEKIERHAIKLKTEQGTRTIALTAPGEMTVPLEKAGVNLRHQTTIQVTGTVAATELEAGQWIEFEVLLTPNGEAESDVTRLQRPTEQTEKIVPAREPENSRDPVPCRVIARVESRRKDRLQLSLARQRFAPRGRLRIRLADDALLEVSENRLDRCRPGDQVTRMAVLELDSGDLVAESIVVELADRSLEVTPTDGKTREQDPFAARHYLRFSDQPSAPRDLRSRYFLLHTDLSERSARMLMDKLDYMITLISQYYGRPPRGLIECYVVRDLAQWERIPMEPAGVAKIRERAGVTISRALGNERKSIVYACDDHGVVQHEAVHAYCAQTFGSTGPTWYSEGMAEMGQYWKKDNLEVRIPPPVIHYLTGSPPKQMLDIVAAGQITGDSWQAYAWRWALCHLLAHNTNYAARFKQLGLNMMSGGSATFESVFGDVAREISFEYDQFVKNFGNGYRVDLCQWDWTTQPVPLAGPRRLKCEIAAGRGWQASRLKLDRGKEYEFAAVGEWKLSSTGESLDADGDTQGRGKLLGVVFDDYQLSEVIELGRRGKFVAPRDGHLYLRCRDDFTGLADNEGTLTVHLRRTQD